MKIIAIIFALYGCIKNIYYGLFEINTKQNKPGGIVVIVLAIIGLILPTFILIKYY